MSEWQPLPDVPLGHAGLAGSRIGYEWQDASGGFPFVRIGAAGHPLVDGGCETRPAHVQMRLAAERPAADDPGEVLELVGQKLKPLPLPSGQRLWLKAHASAIDVLVQLGGLRR